MDPSKIPDQNDLGAVGAAWQWIVFLVGLVLTGGYAGHKAGKAESKIDAAVKDMAESDYLPRMEFLASQARCQEHTWDKLLLALEKRDREFDRKFSRICEGVSRIEQKVDGIREGKN